MRASDIELFSVFTPFSIDLNKGNDGQVEDEEDGKKLGMIKGLASTESPDHENEIIVQGGIDWGYFIEHGWLNWEHQPGFDNAIGHPVQINKGKIDSNGKPATEVLGALWLKDPRAKRIYDNTLALQKAGSARRPGLSIEGAYLARDPNDRRRVTRSRVLNITITGHPMGPDSRFEALARSLFKAADIGYQEPAGTTGADAGSLAPLVPQSLGKKNSDSDYGLRDEQDIDALINMATARFLELFPLIPEAKLRVLATNLYIG